jgi:periplasmic copper chaperone A
LKLPTACRVALLSLFAAAAMASPVGAETPRSEPSTLPSGAQRPQQATHAQPLVVEDAWIRATAGADIAVAYLTVRNASTTAVTVLGVETAVAGHAMIHETRLEGGQSKMRPHESVAVSPGATIKLQPGGLHVMLHDLKRPLVVGEKVPLTVVLAGGATVTVTATVRPLIAE